MDYRASIDRKKRDYAQNGTHFRIKGSFEGLNPLFRINIYRWLSEHFKQAE
jgi:hypothetical protein